MVSKGLDKFVLWPAYFDRERSRAEGRRVPDSVAVRSPDAPWIENAARKLGLDPQIEEKATHPSIPYEKVGRVLVAKKGSKEQVLKLVAQRMRESQDARETSR
ncbi:MAG: signal recognition particle subunit SRP19/SEC65 family protein [Candidatus Thermoplasmatota archaeon]|jgi:signal recognition particle subunit SRP19